MRLTNAFLDNHVAHRLSELTQCGAGELPPSGRPWLGRFLLTALFQQQLSGTERAYRFNFLRRIEGAAAAYESARAALLEYLNTPRSTISPYFQALLEFEVCISQLYQGLELLRKATGKNFFKSGDGSVGERLYRVYGDSHHMEERILNGHIPPEATSALWITNFGLESSNASLTFVELRDCLAMAMCSCDVITTPAGAST